MPNTPMLVQSGASVISKGTNATKDDMELVKKLFRSVGTCDEVDEYLIDPVTALSGSGPAYVSISSLSIVWTVHWTPFHFRPSYSSKH